MNRRAALGLGLGTAAAGALLGTAASAPAQATPDKTKPDKTKPHKAKPGTAGDAPTLVKEVYTQQSTAAGGTWNTYISLPGTDGTLTAAVDEGSDQSVEAYSVNKVPVATAVLDKIDRGELTLDQQIDVTADIVIPGGDGIFSLDGAYPSSVTVGHALAALLTISDDTAVRLCGLVCPAKEINDTLVAKGFPKTQVEPVENPNRFFLGQTTPKEMHDLLQKLVTGQLLSAASTGFLLSLLRSPIAFTDGIRLNMSTNERLNVATKAGWLDDGRNEAGIFFDAAGKPVLTYSMFAHGLGDVDNFSATHPAIAARAVMGRAFLDAVGAVDGVAPKAMKAPAYHPTNGG
ncbi:MAG: serine hydrolase [Actinocatenispora sp.]